MIKFLKKPAASILIVMILIFTLLPMAWGDTTYSSTCAACGHVNTFTEEQVNNEVLYCSNCGALTMVPKGTAAETTVSQWEYVGMDIRHTTPDWGEYGGPCENTMSNEVDFIEGSATFSTECIAGGDFYSPGEAAIGRITWSSPPKRALKPGEKVSVNLEAQLLRYDRVEFLTVCFGLVEYRYTSGEYEVNRYLSADDMVIMPRSDNKTSVSASGEYGVETANTVFATVPDKGDVGDRLTIRVVAQGKGTNCDTVECDYMYAWTGTTEAAAPSGEVTGTDTDPSALIPQIVDSIASETGGNMQPVAVKTAVVIGAVSTLAAAAAAAAASAGSAGAVPERPLSRKEEDDALQKKGDYQMIVNKNFGNTIESGRDDQVLYAWMEQRQPDGSWLYIPAMDGQISIFVVTPAEGLHLDPPPLSSVGKGKGQILRLENEAPPSEVVIAFKFQGPDTYFQNNMTFKLGGTPEIKVQDAFCLLGTVVDVQEIEYSLTGFSGQPEVSLVFTSDLFELKLGKNKQGKTVIFANATEKAGQMKFQRFVHRYPCEILAKTDKGTIKKKFQVHLCYEGIGTAYQGLKNNETPDPIVLVCFTDAEKDKRTTEAFRLPLAVMRWSPSARCLEPDVAAAESLQLEFNADSRSKDIKVDEAVKVVEEAAMIAELETGPSPLKLDMGKKPGVYRIYPNGSPAAGAAEIDLLLTVSDPDNLLDSLTLKAQLKPQVDFRGMIHWFLNYSRGTVISQFLDLGDNDSYMKALEHIENRVYQRDHIPLNANSVIRQRASGSYYEHGKDDITRKSYIAVNNMPKGIGDYDAIRTLYHELTHTLEDILLNQRDGEVSDGAERRAYFLQFIADAAFNLADAERTGDTQRIGSAIVGMNSAFHDGNVIGADTIQQDAAAFGAKCTMTSHELFAYYATIYSGPHAEAIREAVLGMYFPGNISGAPDMHTLMDHDSMLRGYFQEDDGCFKGGKWTFRWKGGQLSRVDFEHPDYTAVVADRRWLPDKGMAMSMRIDLEDKKTKHKDTLQVVMDAGWVSPKRISFERVKDFHTTWRTEVQSSEGILFNLSRGMVETTSTTRWLP